MILILLCIMGVRVLVKMGRILFGLFWILIVFWDKEMDLLIWMFMK